MPWKEVSAMDQRREFVRLALHEGSNRRELCQRFGISRQTAYECLRRYAAGDTELADRSRRPLTSPLQSPPEVENAVLAVRDAHPAWGARKIAAVIRRDGGSSPAVSTVHTILQRHGRIPALPGGPRAKLRFEKEAPNQLWQMDFKGWSRPTETCFIP
jgi:transposase